MKEDRFPNQRAPGSYKGGRKKQFHPRWSYHISAADALNVVRANKFASIAGVPINTHVTINFGDQVPAARVAKIISVTIKNLRQWLRRKGYDGAHTTHIWVREHQASRNAHAHLLLHIPQALKMTNRQFSALLPTEACIDTRQVKNNAQDHSGAPIIVKQRTGLSEVWGRYVLKGIARENSEIFGLKRVERQGRIVGKRVGVAENIGKHERELWDWHRSAFGEQFAREKWVERASMPKRLASSAG